MYVKPRVTLVSGVEAAKPRQFAACMQGVFLGSFAHAEAAALAVAKYKRDPDAYMKLLDELRPSSKGHQRAKKSPKAKKAPKAKQAPKAKKGKKIEKKTTAPKGHKKIAKKTKVPNKKK